MNYDIKRQRFSVFWKGMPANSSKLTYAVNRSIVNCEKE